MRVRNGGTVVNSGTIQKTASNSNGAVRFFNSGAATVINTGRIIDPNGIGLKFESGVTSVAVTLGTGSVIDGGANASAAGGSKAITLTGTGSQDISKIIGFQTLNVTGTGAGWSTTGGGSFSTSATVSSGALTVGGTLTAPNVIVNSGGTLTGTGTISGALTNSGIVAPGASGTPGTVSVNGSYAQASGGTLRVAATPAGTVSKIAVTGAATLAGSVAVEAVAGTYPTTGTPTAIVTTTTGRSGTFSGVTANFAYLTPTLSYDTNNAFLTLVGNGGGSTINYASVAQNSNQRSVGLALNQLSSLSVFNSVFQALATLTTPQAQAALNQLGVSIQITGATASTALQSGLSFNGVVLQSLASLQTPGGGAFSSQLAGGQRVQFATTDFDDLLAQVYAGPPLDQSGRWGAWANGFGVSGGIGEAGVSRLTYTTGGAAFGIDYRLDPDWILGIGFGHAHTDSSLDNLGSSSTTDSTSTALYSGYRFGPAYVSGSLGYGYAQSAFQRRIEISGLPTSRAEGDAVAHQILASVESGYGFSFDQGVTLTPFLGLQSAVLGQDGFTERNAGVLNQTVGGTTNSTLRSIVGAQATKVFAIDDGFALSTQTRIGWARELLNDGRAVTAQFASAPGVGFTSTAAKPQRDSALVGLALGANIAGGFALYGRYDGVVNGVDATHAVTGGLRYSW